MKVLLCGCLVPVGDDMAIRAIHPPCTWDGHCSVVWALRHGCYLSGDRGRERETEWMTTFVWSPDKKFAGKKWCQNNPGSNGREETSPSSLLLTIKVAYIILKNKPWRNWPHKLGILTICIGFYCDMKQNGNTVVPWLVRTTLSMVLYKTHICMKLFNMASPKFGERGGTNREVVVVTLSSNNPGWYHWMPAAVLP
jgi:hypothetical protein